MAAAGACHRCCRRFMDSRECIQTLSLSRFLILLCRNLAFMSVRLCLSLFLNAFFVIAFFASLSLLCVHFSLKFDDGLSPDPLLCTVTSVSRIHTHTHTHTLTRSRENAFTLFSLTLV